MMRSRGFLLFLTTLGASSCLPGQERASTPMPMPMQGEMTMDMPMKISGPMDMTATELEGTILRHTGSGTSVEPSSRPVPMWMKSAGGWLWMVHGNGFVLDEQQTSRRGGDKLFSTNWIMPMAQRQFGRGELTLRTMLSFEPATVTGREYPLLFQQGETAFGRPITDGQHPHNFFMELGLLYDWRVAEKTLLSLYVAPVGDPAIGPTAYPHRLSAAENPVAALGHHQEDSTHIADDVVTAGLASGIWRVEASGFHGREPNEHRWLIQQGAMNSWSARLTVQPGRNWCGQYSFGRLHSVEALYPKEDQQRMTASVMYNKPLKEGNWASTAVWGRTQSVEDKAVFNSYLLESTWRFRRRNLVWTRLENTDRSDELLAGGTEAAAGSGERAVGRVQAYTFGYDREVGHSPWVSTAIGAQVTTYGVPAALRPVYGSDPAGVSVFLRLRSAGGSK